MPVPVQIVLLVFGLVNAGAPVIAVGPGTWMVLVALLLGKPLGIVFFATLAAWLGAGRVP